MNARQPVIPNHNIPAEFTIPPDAIQCGRELAKGGFGAVYQGSYAGGDVAIKYLSRGGNDDLMKFKREMYLLSKLDHPRIIKMFGAWTDTLPYYIVMQYIPTGDLHSFLNNLQIIIPNEVTYQLALDIAEGLEYLHSNHVLHCDLKSKNILLTPDYRAIITDFGLSHLGVNGDYGSCPPATYTYMAPELMNPALIGLPEPENSRPADVYAFGVLLWELWARKPPYNKVTLPEIARRTVDGQRDAIINAPPFMEILIRGCWNFTPDKRPNMSETLQLLKHHREGDLAAMSLLLEARRLMGQDLEILLKDYYHTIQNQINHPLIQTEKKQGTTFSDTARELLALELLKASIKKDKPAAKIETLQSIDIEKDFLRLPALILQALTIYYDLDIYYDIDLACTDNLKRIEVLQKKGCLAPEVAIAFCELFQFGEQLRRKAHNFYQQDNNTAYFQKDDSTENKMVLDRDEQKKLFALYEGVLLSSVKAARSFIHKAAKNKLEPKACAFNKLRYFPGALLYQSHAKDGSITELLYHCATPNGRRLAHRLEKKAWERSLLNLLTKPEKNELVTSVEAAWLAEGGEIQTCYLHPDIVSQLFNEQGEINTRSNERDGRRIVIPLKDEEGEVIAYAKIYPEMLGFQLMIDDLTWRLCGYGNLATAARLTVTATGQCYPVLISRAAGKTLLNLEREGHDLSDFESELEPSAFSNKVLTNLILRFSDEKKDNLTLQAYRQNDDEKIFLRLVGIDTDHAMDEEITPQGLVNIKSVVYCSNAMKGLIDQRARAEWLNLDPYALLKDALETWNTWATKLIPTSPKDTHTLFSWHDMLEWSKDKTSLWSTIGLSSSTNNFSFVPLTFEVGAIFALYQDLHRMQIALRELPEDASLMTLFNRFTPELAAHYAKVNKDHNRVFSRFDALPSNYKKVEEKPQSNQLTISGENRSVICQQTTETGQQKIQRSLTLVRCRNVQQAIAENRLITPKQGLEYELKVVHSYYRNRRKILKDILAGDLKSFLALENADFIKEQIINQLDWAEIRTRYYSRRTYKNMRGSGPLKVTELLLGTIQNVHFERLKLINCNIITDDLLMEILKQSPDITEITIIGCEELTVEAIQNIAAICKRLEKLTIENLPKLQSISLSARLFTTKGLLAFEKLQYLRIINCPGIEQLWLQAPMLKRLALSRCPKLSDVNVQGKNYLLDLSGWEKLSNEGLKALVSGCQGIRKLKLTGCKFIANKKQNENNPKRVIPQEEYNKFFINNEKYLLFKIFLLGNVCVGKTWCAHRYVNGNLPYGNKTIGVDILTKSTIINDFTYKLQIWDVDGCQKSQKTLQSFSRGSIAIICFIDVTNYYTLLNIKSWIEACAVDHLPILLVGNKTDLVNDRKVTYESVIALQKTIEAAAYLECSAMTGEGIDKVFETAALLAHQYLEKNNLIDLTPNIDDENEKEKEEKRAKLTTLEVSKEVLFKRSKQDEKLKLLIVDIKNMLEEIFQEPLRHQLCQRDQDKIIAIENILREYAQLEYDSYLPYTFHNCIKTLQEHRVTLANFAIGKLKIKMNLLILLAVTQLQIIKNMSAGNNKEIDTDLLSLANHIADQTFPLTLRKSGSGEKYLQAYFASRGGFWAVAKNHQDNNLKLDSTDKKTIRRSI